MVWETLRTWLGLPRAVDVGLPAPVPDTVATFDLVVASVFVVLLTANLVLWVGYLGRGRRALAWVGWVALWPARTVGAGVKWVVLGSIRTLVRRTGTDSYTARLAVVVMAAAALVAGAGGLAFLVGDVSVSSSSAPVIIGFFDLATNPWVYVAAAVLFLRVQLFMLDRVLAWRTAVETGYSYESVRRLAEEAKKPDLETCTRVLAQTGDSREQLVEWIDAAFDGEGHDVPSLATDADADGEAMTDGGSPPNPDDGADGDELEPAVTDAAEDVDGADERETQEDLPLGAQIALARNDIAAGFDIETFLWRAGGPFVVTFLVQLLVLQIWVQWWLYPVMAAVSAFVGAGYYLLADYRHRRRLRTLRHTTDRTRRSDCSGLAKRVDLPETTMYYFFAGGNTYASPDRERLARVGAEVLEDVLEGRRPRPAIEQRYARLLTKYVPTLDTWTQQREKPDIADRLVETVTDSPEGILPQNVLIEQVVEHDRRRALKGLVPVGMGHDPDLVREVYRDLVESHALVEDPVTVPVPDGDTVEVAAVSRGDRRLSRHVLQMRSEFSTWFQRHRETRYDAAPVNPTPEVDPFRLPDEASADAAESESPSTSAAGD